MLWQCGIKCKISVCIIFFCTLKMAATAIESTGSWNPVLKKPSPKLPLGKFEKPTLKPTRVRKIKYHLDWPHGYDQLQVESIPKQKLEVKAGLPVRYINSGYDLTTLLAVSLVSALFGALTYSVVDGSRGGRSFASPFSFLNLIDEEAAVRMLSSFMQRFENPEESTTSPLMVFKNIKFNASSFIPTAVNLTRNSRMARQVKTANSGNVLKWYLAYKKDPVELKCVHNLICESLETSKCAARSINSSFGASLLNGVKYLFGGAGDIADLIRKTVRNPDICDKISYSDFCNPVNSSPPSPLPQGLQAIPPFNLSSIVPRAVNIYHGPLKNSTRVFLSV